jgi:twitching motility two-component system response regulator PilH
VHKILLVEDDEFMSRMFNKLFIRNGFDFQIAGNGEEALDKIRDFIPDLILLDIMLPKMNGLEFLEKIKANPETKDIKVILLTNLGLKEELDRAIKMGAIKYIIKSDQAPMEVVKVVEKVLSED